MSTILNLVHPAFLPSYRARLGLTILAFTLASNWALKL